MEMVVWIVMGYFILLFILGWIFYYLSFPYWERKGFWEKFTWIGFITMCKKIDKIAEPGKTYAKISCYLLNISLILFIAIILILKLLRLF